MAAVAELKFRRGAVLEQHLADGAGAVASYREALELDPTHVGARTALAGVSVEQRRASCSARRSRCWSRSTRRTGDLARLVEVQRIKLGHEKKTDKRVDLLLRIGELEGQLGNTDQAWDAYTRAVAESPASTPAREALENLANILDNWQPLVALYEKALSVKGKEKLPSALERELLLVVAVAYDEKLEQSERAVEYFRRAQSIQPEDASALVALERLYTRTERWSDLVDTLLKKAQLVTDPAEREEIRIRIAHGLGGDARQRRAGDRRLERRPAGQPRQRPGAARARPAVPGARRVPRAGRQPAAAAAIWSPTIPAETIALLGRLGALREQHLGQLGGAVETYAKILQIEPGARETDRGARAHPPQPGARARRRAAAGADLQGPRRLAAPDRRVRGRGAPRRRSRAEDRALQADRRRLRGRAGRSGARLRGPGAGAGRGSAEPRGADAASSGWRARCASWTTWPPATAGWWTSVADPERKNALYHKIARPGRVELGDDVGGGRLYVVAQVGLGEARDLVIERVLPLRIGDRITSRP